MAHGDASRMRGGDLDYHETHDWRSVLVVPAPVVSVVIACSVGKDEAGPNVSRTNQNPTTDPPTVAKNTTKTLSQVFRLSLIIFHLILPTWMFVDGVCEFAPGVGIPATAVSYGHFRVVVTPGTVGSLS
jgi:hypothetical protein